MNVGKPNSVCHFGSSGCQQWGAAVVKTMTSLSASMPLVEPKHCPADLGQLWDGMQKTQRTVEISSKNLIVNGWK